MVGLLFELTPLAPKHKVSRGRERSGPLSVGKGSTKHPGSSHHRAGWGTGSTMIVRSGSSGPRRRIIMW